MKILRSVLMAAVCFVAASANAQPRSRAAAPRPAVREDALDPSPVDRAKDPDIDLFLNDWRNAKPRTMYGKLVFRDILTKLDSADPVRPKARGAVLTAITAVSRATLAPGASVSGRAGHGDRQIFYTTDGTGKLVAGGKTYDLKDGVGFTLTPDFDFRLTNTGKTPLAFYVRTEPVPANAKPNPNIVVVNRFDGDRRIGAHWVHICNGGPSGMTLCTIAPHTMPQPHSHPGEEAWILVKGESILSLGKQVVRMHPGEAYKIPPTGLTAHSNLNLTEEPIEMIYMGPAVRGSGPGGAPDGTPLLDYSRLDNSPINPATEPDVDMYMGNWRDAFPRIEHGNLYVRDMLTALQGPDSLHPTRKGAVLEHAVAVSFAELEPGSTAHPVQNELNGLQETFVVNSGAGFITAGGKRFALSRDKAFILRPGLDYRLTAAGDKYLTFYVVTEKLPAGASAEPTLEVVDDRAKPQVVEAWVDHERPVITKADGLGGFGAVTRVQLGSMAMSRPYSAAPGVEEIWIATDGDVEALLGKRLRKIPAGTAYRVPPTGLAAHANINVSGKPAEFLYMVN
jgi:mannose-6-phosphate isomerase-like protein (cupin superfamily)